MVKLLLCRAQRKSLLGKVIFNLVVRAELTDGEREDVRKYRLGDSLLYERKPLKQSDNEYFQIGNALMHRFMNLTITVNDLASGKTIECKDIVEMLAAEQQVKEAANTFKAVLHAAANFEGEEVIEI